MRAQAAWWRGGNALFLPLGTNGVSERITQKGEVQGNLPNFRADIEHRFELLLGLKGAPTKRDWALVVYTARSSSCSWALRPRFS